MQIKIRGEISSVLFTLCSNKSSELASCRQPSAGKNGKWRSKYFRNVDSQEDKWTFRRTELEQNESRVYFFFIWEHVTSS